MKTKNKLPKALLGLVVGLVVLAVALALSLASLSPDTPGQEISINGLDGLLAGGQVTAATLHEQDSRVVLETAQGERWSAYPAGGNGTANLVTRLTQSGAEVTIDQQWAKRTVAVLSQFILPLLLLADLFGIIILLARGGSSQVKDLFAFSRIGAKRATTGGSGLTFADVAAVGDAVTELAEVRDYLADPQRFAAFGALPPKGVLLYGPPGCGKTLLAKALAGEANVPFYFISGSEFVESLVGVGAARVRDLFRQAAATAPAIVFIDELDAAGRRRGAGVGGGNDEREQTLNEMLVQMDGFSPSLGVVVIGATNRPDILDPALLRPGRFDRQVSIDPPDVAGRLEILQLHAATRRLGPGADLEPVARATPGFSGADLANVVNEAALLALRRKAPSVGAEDLAEGVQRVLAGPRRKGRLLTPEEIDRLAHHEAGHVVVAAAVDYPASVQRVSIVARGRHAGHADLLPRTDRTVLTRDELLAELAIAMAGTAAEALVFGSPSTAGEADLERATDMARRLAGRYGMSEEVGPVRVLQNEAEVFLGRDLASAAQHVSPRTLEAVDDAVHTLVTDALAQATDVLQRRRQVLDDLAAALVERETLEEVELVALLEASGARPTRRRRAPIV